MVTVDAFGRGMEILDDLYAYIIGLILPQVAV